MADRYPWAVPDDDPGAGWDTDGDGVPDTAVRTDGVDLVLSTDLDGDGLADQELRIGPDGVVREADPPDPVLDGLLGGVDLGRW